MLLKTRPAPARKSYKHEDSASELGGLPRLLVCTLTLTSIMKEIHRIHWIVFSRLSDYLLNSTLTAFWMSLPPVNFAIVHGPLYCSNWIQLNSSAKLRFMNAFFKVHALHAGSVKGLRLASTQVLGHQGISKLGGKA